MQQVSLNEAASICKKVQQPLPVSVDGGEVVYLMNESVYREYLDAVEFTAVMEGIKDIEAGRCTDGDKFFSDMGKKYGI